MAAIYARQGARCQEHPHRPADGRCDRCELPFCPECLTPTDRRADGTRDWFCARCVRLNHEDAQREAYEQSIEHRVAVAARRARIVTISLAGAILLLVVSTAGYFLAARRFGAAAPAQAIAERATSCGELSRIRSIGAIGAPAPDDAINVLAYPNRAAVRLLTPSAAAPNPEGDPALASMIDECVAGWRGTDMSLPLTIEIEVRAEGAVPIQRIALWQEPTAPRGAWVRDFELLASPSAEGNDFTPLTLDRAARLEPTEEQQWFTIVQTQAMGLTLDRVARGGEQATGTQPQPEVVSARRLRLRVLSTHGTPGPGATSIGGTGTVPKDGVALGEIAAYGPDQQLTVAMVCANITPSGKDSCAYGFQPAQIRALAGRPRFVYFVNDTDSPHTFTTTGQDKNADVRVEPGRSASIVFTAASRGTTFDFYCRIADHAAQGMRGRIAIR
ncbi:MAG TPA: hypothetical protein VFX49_20230 [Chloroflexota bacterium]|nr:hypothetical protein [Chloroflexota bacterium]